MWRKVWLFSFLFFVFFCGFKLRAGISTGHINWIPDFVSIQASPPRVIFPREFPLKLSSREDAATLFSQPWELQMQPRGGRLIFFKKTELNAYSLNCKEQIVIMQFHLMVINIYIIFTNSWNFLRLIFILWAKFLFSTKQLLFQFMQVKQHTPVVHPLTWLGISSRSKIDAGKKHYIPARILEHMIQWDYNRMGWSWAWSLEYR